MAHYFFESIHYRGIVLGAATAELDISPQNRAVLVLIDEEGEQIARIPIDLVTADMNITRGSTPISFDLTANINSITITVGAGK